MAASSVIAALLTEVETEKTELLTPGHWRCEIHSMGLEAGPGRAPLSTVHMAVLAAKRRSEHEQALDRIAELIRAHPELPGLRNAIDRLEVEALRMPPEVDHQSLADVQAGRGKSPNSVERRYLLEWVDRIRTAIGEIQPSEKMSEGFRLIGEGLAESPDLLHFAIVYDQAENWCGPVVHTFQDVELLKAVLRRCLERIESGEHEAHRLAVHQ